MGCDSRTLLSSRACGGLDVGFNNRNPASIPNATLESFGPGQVCLLELHATDEVIIRS